MAQSSSPSLSRASNITLEYPSYSEATASPSPSSSSPASATAKTRANYDCLARKHACDTLRTPPPRLQKDADHYHRPLERDLRRLDIETDQHILSQNYKPLIRTESISLPTTPIEQKSARFQPIRHDDDGNDDDDDGADDQSMSLSPQTDYMVELCNQDIQELLTDEAMSNSKR